MLARSATIISTQKFNWQKRFDCQDLQLSFFGIPSLQSSAFSGKFVLHLILLWIVLNCDWFPNQNVSILVTFWEDNIQAHYWGDPFWHWVTGQVMSGMKIASIMTTFHLLQPNLQVPDHFLILILRLAQVTVQGILSQLAGAKLIPAKTKTKRHFFCFTI